MGNSEEFQDSARSLDIAKWYQTRTFRGHVCTENGFQCSLCKSEFIDFKFTEHVINRGTFLYSSFNEA